MIELSILWEHRGSDIETVLEIDESHIRGLIYNIEADLLLVEYKESWYQISNPKMKILKDLREIVIYNEGAIEFTPDFDVDGTE